MDKVTFEKLENKEHFYCRYDGQYQAQPVYITLDPEKREITVDYDSSVGGGVPSDVWHGLILRWSLNSSAYLGRANNEFIADLMPLFETVCNEYEERWDGNNNVGGLTDKGTEAEYKIERHLAEAVADSDNCLVVFGAEDYFYDAMGEVDECIEKGMSDAAIEEHFVDEFSSTMNGVLELENMDGFLEERRQELKEESEEN